MKCFRHLVKIILISFLCGVVWAETALELVAPGGGEIDLQGGIMKYYAAGRELVVVRWKRFTLEAKQLEHNREKAILKGKGLVKLTEEAPLRILRSEEITADISRDYFEANGAINIYDETTSFAGNRLEWDRQRDQFELTGDVEVKHHEWRLTGDRIEGRLNTGVFTILGQVQATGGENSVKAGRIIFEQGSEKLTFQENPILINGKNELSATEIIYDMKTEKVSASGVVKSRIIE